MNAQLYRLIFLTFLLSLNFTVLGWAQNDATHKQFSSFILNYNLPLRLNGLSVTSFRITPRIRLDVFDKSAKIILDIDAKQGTSDNPDPAYTHSYNYMGKQYGNQHVGFEPFKQIEAVRTSITYEVLVTYGSQSWGWTKVIGNTLQFGPIDKNAKASDVNVNVRIVAIGSFSGTSAIENRIRTLLANDLAEKKKAEENTKSVNTAAKDNKSSNNNQQNMSKSSATTASGKAAAAARPDPGIAQNNNAGKLSDKVNVNGESMQVFKQDGKNYIKKADGTVFETTKQGYDAIESASLKKAASKTAFQNSLNAEREKQELQNKLNRDAYNAQQALNAAKEERQRVNMQIATQAVGLATEIFGELKANRERKLAENKRIQEENAERLERERVAFNLKRQKIAARKTFITSIKDTGIPLSADHVDSDKIYFFAYSYDINTLENDPGIYLSNIFQIAKYSDGTWPYTPNVKKELSKANNYRSTIMIGYYLTKGEAESEYEAFKKNLDYHKCAISSFEYVGKPQKQAMEKEKSTSADLDFWGNPIKQKL